MTTERHSLALRGCAPEPLMAYLKALGIFRLVAEQKDSNARAWWQEDSIFHLESTLERKALLDFFLEEYRPTPIVAPWNGGSGFYPRDEQEAINTLCSLPHHRLTLYQETISAVKGIGIMSGLLKQFEDAERVQNPDAKKKARTEANTARSQAKDAILAECRNELPDLAVSWLDAVYVLTSRGPSYPPLLGTGGNDGRLEFTNHFMQNLLEALPGASKDDSSNRRRAGVPSQSQCLQASLFNDVPVALRKAALGQFQSGEVLTNPWDYVLMLEGALLFAGAVARRLSAESRSRAVFPFTVETSAAGYGTAVDVEYTSDGSRAELWAPLWQRPATYREITHLFGEGRAQLGRRQAATGTDFARAVVGLGIDRGVSSFQRFGFLKRNGLAFIATPLGRLKVNEDAALADQANLLFDLEHDQWLARLRDASRGQNAPAGLGRAVREIDRAILDFCAHASSGPQGARLLQEVLIAAGGAERWLARARNLRGRPNPLQGLSPQWLQACDDGSAEFRLAASLASIRGSRDRTIGPIRVNLESVTYNPRSHRWEWDDDNPLVVWRSGDPLLSMAAVLERRLLDARMVGVERLHLDSSLHAPLADVHVFLDGGVEYQRIADLLLPLAGLKWWESEHQFTHAPAAPTLSRAYAVMKLLLLPWPFTRSQGGEPVLIQPEPSLLPLLRSSQAHRAYQIAARRLHISGLTPLVKETAIAAQQQRTLAAALLIPIRYRDMGRLAELALMPREEDQ